jgi:hypothetical protein
MFAGFRRYRLARGSMDDLVRRVDESFAEDIARQPGFVSYEFMDCGDGEIMTVSVFETGGEAEASRELAQRWTEENLGDMDFARMDALRGEILVSRADQDMLTPSHAGSDEKFASARRYMLRRGSVQDLMHVVDEQFADRLQEMDGFDAYHALDCGRGEVLSISLFRDQPAAEESDELALQFVREQLTDFDLERTEVVGGRVTVSRAVAQLLEPAHA